MDSIGLDFGSASIALSLLLGVLCVGRIRSYDVHEKESYLKLFLVAVYGGLLAAAASLLGYRLASALGFGEFHSWYGFFLFVGPIEEGAKYLGLRATRVFYGNRLNEATDGVVYMAAVALGFSLIENFMYANAGLGNGHLLWLRLLLATPGHILFSFPMGLSHYLAREEGHPRWTVPASFGLACAAHGAYNNLCSAPLGLLLAPAFLVLLWLGLLAVLRYSHSTSPFRTTLDAFLRHLPPAVRSGLRCHQCGFAGDMAHYSHGDLELQRCGDCGHFVVTRENAVRLFHRFAPEFRSLKGEYAPSAEREGYRALYGVVHVHEESGSGWFHGDAMDAKLAEITGGLRARLERRTLIRFLFRPPRPSRPPRPLAARDPARWTDLLLALLGAAICVAWGLSHLAGHRMVSLHPALSHSWQDSAYAVSYPKGWTLNVWTSGDGRQVSLNLGAQGHAAVGLRGQAWEVDPEEAAGNAARELLANLGGREKARRTLERWGRFEGAGTEVDLSTPKGGEMRLSVFAWSGGGRSFVAVEMVEEAYREALHPGLDLVRNTLRIKPRPALPRPSGSPEPGEDTSVTRALRLFLSESDTLPPDAPADSTPPPGFPPEPDRRPAE